MGLPEIGLEAIFQNGDFLKAMSEYQKSVSGGKRETETAAQAMTRNLATVGGGIVTAGLAAAAAAISTVTAAAVASIPAVMGWAETLDGIGDVLGTTSDESAGLAVAIDGVGGNVDAISGQMAFMARGLMKNKYQLGPVGEEMKSLGISFRDAKGEILPTTQIIQNIADKVGVLPDGLQKTQMMTRLFGKSGKDLSDVLTNLSNGGLARATERAEALGLTLGEDTTNDAIMLGRQFKFVEMMVKGLFISMGKELLPVLSPLVDDFTELATAALPKVRTAISFITTKIGEFVRIAVEALPQIIAVFQQIGGWLMSNQWVIIGILGAMGVAVAVFVYTTVLPALGAMIAGMATTMAPFLAVAAVIAALAWAWQNNFLGMRDTLTAFWNETVYPALQALWQWLSVNIPIAIQTLVQFWQGTLYPALQTVWAWIQSVLFPLLQSWWQWLSVNVPAAIQILVNFWQGTLWPALQAVWAWIQAYLIPLFEALGELLGVTLQYVVQEMSKLWTGTLQPALQAVWSWIQEKLIPAVTEFWSWLSEKLKPIVSDVSNFLEFVFVGALRTLEGMIQSVIGWVKRLADALKKLVIPKDLQPGSPTPFEIGLRGVGDAVKQVTGALTPLQMRLDGVGSSSISGQATAPTPAASVTNVSNVFNMGGQTVNNGMDVATLRNFIIKTVREAI